MKQKVFSSILILAMLMTLLAGCGQGKKNSTDVATNGGEQKGATEGSRTFNGIDITKPVKLTMYLIGDRTPDFDKVYDEINKILQEKLNTTVEVKFLGWSEHDKKYSLLFSGGEDFDLIFTASQWGHYEATAGMGGFYPLAEDFIKTYAPDIWNTLPDMAWDQAKIGGNVYMVPNYQNEFGASVVAVRGDLMNKYGYSDITSFDQLIEFYGKVAENEKTLTPLGTQGSALLGPYLLANKVRRIGGAPKELFLYNTQDTSDLSITYALDWNKFTDYCKMTKELYEKGYWSPDSLATTEETQDGFLNGRAASFMWNKGTAVNYCNKANKEHPEWKCTIVDVVPDLPKQVNPYINNGVSINAASKNKERAMMVLNEFYTNKEVSDLSAYGINGVNYEAVGDDKYKKLEGEANYGIDKNCNWGWINSKIRRKEYVENPTELDLKQQAIQDKWSANIKPEHLYDGFTFDTSMVSTEIAAVTSVLDQYYTPLILGMVDDVDKSIAELRQQLENAGIQVIYDEIKKQAEAYKSSKK